MAAAKAEMQLLPPLQISEPFGAFPHSPPAMDSHYPKLEEMMLLSGGGPQFLAPPGAPESAGFAAAGEPGEQHFEHLAAGKSAGLALEGDGGAVPVSRGDSSSRGGSAMQRRPRSRRLRGGILLCASAALGSLLLETCQRRCNMLHSIIN